MVKDTMWVSDTIMVDAVSIDTIISLSDLIEYGDTIIIYKDRITSKIYFYRDSLFFYSECDSIFIVNEIPVIIDGIKIPIKEKTFWMKVKDYFLFAFLLVILVLMIILIKTKNNGKFNRSSHRPFKSGQ